MRWDRVAESLQVQMFGWHLLGRRSKLTRCAIPKSERGRQEALQKAQEDQGTHVFHCDNYKCVCVCGVAEYPATTFGYDYYRKGWQQGRESATNEDTLVTLVKQLETSSCVSADDTKSLWPPWLRRCLCFLFFLVTCSLLEGSQVPAEAITRRPTQHFDEYPPSGVQV